jgi:glycosyltransferase involved in cell wall biosynthesis
MQTKKVLFLGISSHLGGAERSLFDLVEKTMDVAPSSLVVLPGEGPLAQKLKEKKISVLFLQPPKSFQKISRKSIASIILFLLFGIPPFFLYLLRLVRILKREQPTAVHSTGIKNHILCLGLSLALPFQFFIHLRDFIHNPMLIYYFSLFKKKKSIHWMAASSAITRNLFWHIPIFYDGISSQQFFSQKNTLLKTKHNIPSSALTVAHIAALTPWKGQKLFIKAAVEILKQRSDLHFFVVGSHIYTTKGDESYKDELVQMVKQAGAQSHIHFEPFTEAPEVIYNGVDLVVHSSISPEPFGRVIVEALFCETPVCAADEGGVLEIFRDYESLKNLHRTGDPQSLEDRIVYCLENSNIFLALYPATRIRFDAQLCFSKQIEYILA